MSNKKELKKFGDKLKKIREKKGFTQKCVATWLGITEATMSHYESGQREPGYLTIGKLTDALEVDVEELF